MSRIGNAPITVPKEASVQIQDGTVVVKGPKGELFFLLPGGITVKHEGEKIEVTCGSNDKKTRALHGLVRAQLANNVTGVTTGWSKMLELTGVGYRASLSGVNLQLTVGFSHPVIVAPPEGITFQITEGKIVVSGIDKQLVGQMAAKIRAIKKPEPYKGKGIKYVGEHIRKKAGKSAKAVGGAPGAK